MIFLGLLSVYHLLHLNRKELVIGLLYSGLDMGKMNFPGDQASKGSPGESELGGSLPADRQTHFSEIAPSPCPGQEPRSDIFSYE